MFNKFCLTLFFCRADKDRAALAAELEDVHGQLGNSKKQKASADKNNRALEDQLNELRGKISDLESGLAESENRYTTFFG